MKNYLKLTGLMMSALLCMFTSCTSDDDDKVIGDGGVTSVKVEMLVSAETLKWAEGSFVVTFSPSGKTEEITANDIFFAIEANPVTDAELLKEFKSKKVMKATSNFMCDRSDTKVTVKPNLKVKQGTATTDDVTYDYEVTGAISYHKGIGGEHGTHSRDAQSGIKGSILADYLRKHNISLVWIDLR